MSRTNAPRSAAGCRSLTRGGAARDPSRIPAPLSPLGEDGVDVERREIRGRPLGGGAVRAGDLGIDGAHALAHVGLVAKSPEPVERALHLRPDLESLREDGELLALEELLDPPERIVRRIEPGDRLALALELVEGAV